MPISVPANRPVLARRVGLHEETSRTSALVMLALLIFGICSLLALVISLPDSEARADRPTRPLSPLVGARAVDAPADAADAASSASVFEAVPALAPPPVSAPASAVEPAPAAAPAAPAPATDAPSPLAVNRSARVANTEGVGVILHTAPRTGARAPRGLLEGAQVTIVEASGADWVRVRTQNGLDGWVPTRYLAPTR